MFQETETLRNRFRDTRNVAKRTCFGATETLRNRYRRQVKRCEMCFGQTKTTKSICGQAETQRIRFLRNRKHVSKNRNITKSISEIQKTSQNVFRANRNVTKSICETRETLRNVFRAKRYEIAVRDARNVAKHSG